MDGRASEPSRSTEEIGEPEPEGTRWREGGGRETEPQGRNMAETPSSTTVTTKLERIAKLAREGPTMAFTSLSHHIDVEFLKEAFRRTRKDGAVGVDGRRAKKYAEDLEGNLTSLLHRFKAGIYQAPPVRRVHIPKGDGKARRPIGIPTFEDKVLQRAVTMVVEAIYEQDFRACSWGFRPGRSAHQALEALQKGLMKMAGGWVIEVDIQSFFDALDRGHLRNFLDLRVRDGVLRRTIDKWLRAGVFEKGRVKHPELGTPQGGVISPILANVFLHEVLDVWFEDVVKPRMKGEAFLVRYADDFVLVFARQDDARRVMDVLPKRFGKYGLTLHSEKTRMLRFRFPRTERDEVPGSFDFLGFTHVWSRARVRKGVWVVKRSTAKSRLSRGLKRVKVWCRKNRHQRIADQHRTLEKKLRGHYAYYGLRGNAHALRCFRYGVLRIWQKWLNRRSQHRGMRWERFYRLLERYPLLEPVGYTLRPRPQRSRIPKSRMR